MVNRVWKSGYHRHSNDNAEHHKMFIACRFLCISWIMRFTSVFSSHLIWSLNGMFGSSSTYLVKSFGFIAFELIKIISSELSWISGSFCSSFSVFIFCDSVVNFLTINLRRSSQIQVYILFHNFILQYLEPITGFFLTNISNKYFSAFWW